jgi:hypothetical protein
MRRILIAVSLLAVAAGARAEGFDDRPLKDAVDADPTPIIAIEAVEPDGSTTPLVVNSTGTALTRGVGSPTSLSVVEGSRIAIPRAADGSCPDVDVTLTATFANTPLMVFEDPAALQPRRYKAGTTEADLQHVVDPVACEVVVTRVAGRVAYRPKLLKHLAGKTRRDFEAALANPEPTPTPDPSRAGAPSSMPEHPAFRATTAGTIEPAVGEPRSMRLRDSEWDTCIYYEFFSQIETDLKRYSLNDPLQTNHNGATAGAYMTYWEYPWRNILRMNRTTGRRSLLRGSYIESGFSSYAYVGQGRSYAPEIRFDNTFVVIYTPPPWEGGGTGPGFSVRASVWAAPWDQHQEKASRGVVPSLPWPYDRTMWRWIAEEPRHGIRNANWMCDANRNLLY